MRCLFLPENLAAVLYAEQKLFQSLVNFQFRKTIPFFRTDKMYSTIKIYPPAAFNGLIVRPCDTGQPSAGTKNIEGFVLGNAGEHAGQLIEKTGMLKTLTDLPVFSTLSAKSWYFADFTLTEDKRTGLCSWTIGQPEWHKAAEPRETL